MLTRCWYSIGNAGSALSQRLGRGPGVVVSTAVFHARVRGSFPGLGGLKETKMFLPNPLITLSIVGPVTERYRARP